MLEVQKYLLEHGIEKLVTDYRIKVVEREDCILLDYSQIESPKTHPIVIECRGLILSKDYKTILCKSFDRFFNYGECVELQEEFRFDTAVVSEKVDGSIMRLYYHPSRGWTVATRKNPYGDNVTPSDVGTFDSMFKMCVDWDKLVKVLDTKLVYVFEMVTPYNRVVKSYGNVCNLYLLSIFCQHSGKEVVLPNEIGNYVETVFGNLGIKSPKTYPLTSYQSICDYMSQLDETDEGFVVFDTASKIRVKIKNPSYLAIFSKRINGVITTNTIVKMVMDNEYAEYLTYFQEDTDIVMPYVEAYEGLRVEILNTYEQYKHIENQKEFAEVAKQFPYSAILFKLRKGKTYNDSIKTFTVDYVKYLLLWYINS